MNLIKSVAAISLCSLSLSVMAEPSVTTNAFITTGFSFTDSKVNYNGVGRNPNFSDVSKMGIQFRFDPDIDLPITFTAQLLAKGRADWSVEAEWAYLSYTPTDNLTVTVGKILSPIFMLSQSIDVGITYPWSTPPEEMFGPANVPFSSIAGIDITYTDYLGDYEYLVKIYNGENEFTVPAAGLSVEVDMQRMSGVVFELTNDYGMLRYSIHTIEFTDQLFVATAGGFPSTTDGKVLFTTFGGKFEWENIIVIAEKAKRALSNSMFPTSHTWFATLGYRIDKYLPTLTYSEIETSNSLINQGQNSLIAGLEITTSASTRLNFEVIRISLDSGSAGLFDTFPVSLGGQAVDDTTKVVGSFSMVF